MEKIAASGSPATKLFINVLRITCFCIFAGRAWQHLVWDAPFRTLLWDQEWMQHIIESITSMTWEEYTTSPRVDMYIQGAIKATGWLYAACAVLTLFIRANMKRAGYVLLGAALSLTFLAFLDYKEKFFETGMLLEHVVQVSAPVLLFMALFAKLQHKKLIVFAKAAIALTFLGHGLYAWGYYPQPGPFVDMLINIMHFTEGTAREILKVAAVLDFAVAVLIFVPRASRMALLYCIAWGGLTAMARMASGFDSNFIMQSLNQYTFEVMFRLSHALIPLWVFYAEGKRVWKRSFVKKEETNSVALATVTVN